MERKGAFRSSKSERGGEYRETRDSRESMGKGETMRILYSLAVRGVAMAMCDCFEVSRRWGGGGSDLGERSKSSTRGEQKPYPVAIRNKRPVNEWLRIE